MVHLARATPPSLFTEVLGIFDLDIRCCFTECTSVDVSDVTWQQAQLSPSRGGLGLRSLLHHSSACFTASIGHSGITIGENHHLEQSVDDFNGFIADTEAIICLQDILDTPPCQRYLSSKIEDHQLKILLDHSSSLANRARLLPVSSPHASAWLSVIPTPQLSLHLEPPEFQVALKWWLGIRTRPADILVHDWEFGKPAALDFTITSPLNHSALNEPIVMVGSAALAAELGKHAANDEKCNRLGWFASP